MAAVIARSAVAAPAPRAPQGPLGALPTASALASNRRARPRLVGRADLAFLLYLRRSSALPNLAALSHHDVGEFLVAQRRRVDVRPVGNAIKCGEVCHFSECLQL